MTVTYLDTSAAAKLLVDEPESAALAEHLDAAVDDGDELVASMLLETELRRLAVRLELQQAAVTKVLTRIDLVEPDRALFAQAGLLPGRNLRSLDALHLATAVRFAADSVVAYDHRLLEAAEAVGISTTSPRWPVRSAGRSIR